MRRRTANDSRVEYFQEEFGAVGQLVGTNEEEVAIDEHERERPPKRVRAVSQVLSTDNQDALCVWDLHALCSETRARTKAEIHMIPRSVPWARWT